MVERYEKTMENDGGRNSLRAGGCGACGLRVCEFHEFQRDAGAFDGGKTRAAAIGVRADVRRRTTAFFPMGRAFQTTALARELVGMVCTLFIPAGGFDGIWQECRLRIGRLESGNIKDVSPIQLQYHSRAYGGRYDCQRVAWQYLAHYGAGQHLRQYRGAHADGLLPAAFVSKTAVF